MNKYQDHIKIIDQLLWPKGIGGLIVFLIGLFSALILSNFSFRDLNDYRKIYRWHSNSATIEELAINNRLLSIKYKYKVGEYYYISSKLYAKGISKAEITEIQKNELEEKKNERNTIEIKFNPKNPSESVYLIDATEIYYTLILVIFSLYSLLIYILVISIKLKKIHHRCKSG